MPGACEPSWKLLCHYVRIPSRFNIEFGDGTSESEMFVVVAVCGCGRVLYLCLYATRQSSYVPDGPWLIICSLFVKGLWRSLDAVWSACKSQGEYLNKQGCLLRAGCLISHVVAYVLSTWRYGWTMMRDARCHVLGERPSSGTLHTDTW